MDNDPNNIELIENPYSWNKLSSMVYLEQPAGVGFSYVTGDAVLDYGDKSSTADMMAAVDSFYELFPERRTNIMYLASESYGGHYIPQLSLKMIQSANKFYIKEKRFRGVLVGNPYTSFGSGEIAGALTLWGLQLVPRPLWYVLSAWCHRLSVS